MWASLSIFEFLKKFPDTIINSLMIDISVHFRYIYCHFLFCQKRFIPSCSSFDVPAPTFKNVTGIYGFRLFKCFSIGNNGVTIWAIHMGYLGSLVSKCFNNNSFTLQPGVNLQTPSVRERHVFHVDRFSENIRLFPGRDILFNL